MTRDFPRLEMLCASHTCDHCKTFAREHETQLALHLFTVHHHDWKTAQIKAREILEDRR